MDPLVAMWLGSTALTLASLAIGIVVHRIGLGRIAPAPALGLPGRRLRADAPTYRATHRAATPLTWGAENDVPTQWPYENPPRNGNGPTTVKPGAATSSCCPASSRLEKSVI